MSLAVFNNGVKQIFKLPVTPGQTKQIAAERLRLLEIFQKKGLFITCIGFRINGVGLNNPLFQCQGVLTKTPDLIYAISNSDFRLFEDADYPLLDDNLFSVTISFGANLTFNELEAKLEEEEIHLDYQGEHPSVFLHTLNEENTLTLIFKVVRHQEEIEQIIYENSLNDAFVVRTSKSIEVTTAFEESSYVCTLTQHLCNFEELINEL